VFLTSLGTLARAADQEASESACVGSLAALSDLSWVEIGNHVLPTLVANAPVSNAVCTPFVNDILKCHILLLGKCSRLVVASDLERWQVSTPTLAHRAVENLDRLAAPIDLNRIWLGSGLPEAVSHSSVVGTAAAWALTRSFQEKVRALQPGAWFVAMPQPDYLFAWPAGQSTDILALHLKDLKNQLSLAAAHRKVLTRQIFILFNAQLRIASPQEVGSGLATSER